MAVTGNGKTTKKTVISSEIMLLSLFPTFLARTKWLSREEKVMEVMGKVNEWHSALKKAGRRTISFTAVWHTEPF